LTFWKYYIKILTGGESVSRRNKKVSPAIERRRYKLLQQVHTKDAGTLKAKVAYILNHYPQTRNNDKLLTIKVWEVFHPDRIIDGDKIRLQDILNLPKAYDMQRYRAEIQNQLGLFLPSLQAQETRRHRQDHWKEEMQFKNVPKITVFTSEGRMGKDCLVFGSIWIYDADNDQVENRITTKLMESRSEEGLDCDFSFESICRENVEQVRRFFRSALEFAKVISFKAHVVRQHQDQYDYFSQYEKHLVMSVDFDLNNHRIFPPKNFVFVKSVNNPPGISEWEKKQNIVNNISEAYKGDMRIEDIYTLKTGDSVLLQIADLFAGSVSVAYQLGGEHEAQDYFTGFALGLLGINPLNLTAFGDNDWVNIEIVD
jgi:hypothetical protein